MHTRRKVPLTFEQHQTIGVTLYVMRTQLQRIGIWLANTYRNSAMRPVEWVVKRIDRLRSDMDDRIAQEFPDRRATPEAWCVYYPGGHHDASRRPEPPEIHTAEEVLTALWPMAEQLGAVAQQLFYAYPVSLGDRLIPLENQLRVLSHDIPDLMRSDLPKRCLGGMVYRNGNVVRSDVAHIETLVREVERRKAHIDQLEVSCWYEDRVIQLPGRRFLQYYGQRATQKETV